MNFEALIGQTISQAPSATANWLGFTLEHIEKGAASIRLEIREEMTNPYKNLHGGMMACIIDECIGWAVLSLESEQNYTTLNLNVDFLYAIAKGQYLTAHSKVIRAGKKIINVSCEVYDDAHQLLATASSNLVQTSMKFKTS